MPLITPKEEQFISVDPKWRRLAINYIIAQLDMPQVVREGTPEIALKALNCNSSLTTTHIE